MVTRPMPVAGELIASKATKAKDFTNQRTRYAGTVDEAVRAKNRNKSKIRSRVEHVFGVVERLWGWQGALPRFAEERHTGVHSTALANICSGRQRLTAQVRP